MATAIGSINEYTRNENWAMWFERLEQYFLANGVQDERKAALFLTLLGGEGYAILRNLCAPVLPSTKTFAELSTIMKKHMEPTPNVILERFKFKQCRQRDGEDIKAFIEELKRISTHCNFGENQQDCMRDQFVWGLRAEALQKRLLREKDLTFDKAAEMATAFESASRGAASIHNNGIGRNEDQAAVKYISDNRKTKPGGWRSSGDNRNNNQGKKECFRCGRDNHIALNCRFRDYKCNKCNKIGHLALVCKTKRSENGNKGAENLKRKEQKRNANNQHFLSEYRDLNDDFDKVFRIAEESSENINNVKPYEVTLNVENSEMTFEIDTGSPISAISTKFFENSVLSKTTLHRTNRKFKSYSGDPIVPCGIVVVEVKNNNECHKLELFVLPGTSLPIIGRDWLSILNILKEDKRESVKTIKIGNRGIDSTNYILQEFDDVFSDRLGKYTKGKFKLHLKENAIPVFLKPRPVPYAMRAKIETELDRLVNEGILVPVESSDWATPIVPVLKSNGQMRICGDYKVTLNPNLVTDRYPVPRIQDLFAKIKPGPAITKIDLSQAYQQVELEEESRPLTTISTHKGLFVYKRLSFGISSAPGLFQREIEKLLGGIEGVVGFFDDILITGETKEKHDERLREVLRRFKEAGLKLNKTKCKFAVDKVNFLGYELSKKGIQVSDERIEAILKMKKPNSVVELQSFLGMINYYSKFIRNYSSIVHPLYKLLQKNKKWMWSSECERAFMEAKRSLTSCEVLMPYDEKLPLKITTDASPFGIGAVLSHVLEGNIERPVAFASRTLTKAETNYSQLDREALGLVFGVKTFHQFVYGRHFVLETDHRPLTFIFGKKKGLPQMAASRVQRWSVFLSGYDFEIRFIQGKDNGSADFLSRCVQQTKSTGEKEANNDFTYLNFVTNGIKVISVEVVQEETNADPILSRIKKFIRMGWPNKVPDSLMPFMRKREELYLENKCIMWGHRIVVPESLQKELLEELHSAHMGIVRMKALARSYIWWPKIDQDIENVSKTCKLCLESADNPQRSVLHTWDWPDGPNHRLHADFLGPIKGRMYLIIVDAFSKWVDVKEMTNIRAPETIEMFREYFCTWGIPFNLVTDNGPTFTSELFSEFVRKNGIRHIKTAPYHPATNGAAENSVKTFKAKFKLLLGKNDRHNSLMKYLFHYRSSPHCTTGVSPAELQCGRKFRTRWDLLKSMVGERVTQRQNDQKRYFRGNRKITFANKEIVMARDYACDKWRKSEVIEKLSPVSYKVRTDDDRIWKRHIDQLRPANVPFEVGKSENTENYDYYDDEDTAENVGNKTDVVASKEIVEEPKSVSEPVTMPQSVNIRDIVANTPNVKADAVQKPASTPPVFVPRRSTRIKRTREIFRV